MSLKPKIKVLTSTPNGLKLPKKKSKQKKILIASSWRSGSTFLGDFFSHYPSTYYIYEPFKFFKDNNGSIADMSKSLNLLKNLYGCQFFRASVKEYLYLKYKDKERKFNADPYDQWSKCSSSPNIVIKTVRLRLESIEEFLQSNANFYLILLVRDPRGVKNSRLKQDWCRIQPKCIDTSSICQDLSSDTDEFTRYKVKYPQNVWLVRYEDLTFKPYDTLYKLVAFLQLPTDYSKINNYLALHTGKTANGLDVTKSELIHRYKRIFGYTMRQNPKQQVFKWTEQLSQKDILQIEELCSKPMKFLGYNTFHNQTDLKTMIKSLNQVWP